ncbi:hypothetical protein PIB30_058824 [Stylosanthes scabra]|uniref:Uncharacterized protein n=1 Tax=Stylosanthes scabra TaxID=79078 RepID=A0ABU6SLE3_9FABA|nr:hypothetical protein [Stylosanthes scabra]
MVEVLKEGLLQIKDILIDNSIGYKEARHQESLVQKKLSKTLGHSSRCLFTLLLYYLYGIVSDIEVDMAGGIYKSESDKYYLYMRRILTSDSEKMVGRGVKQLDRALSLFKFVWETAEMKGHLDLQGHLWCVGEYNRVLRTSGTSITIFALPSSLAIVLVLCLGLIRFKVETLPEKYFKMDPKTLDDYGGIDHLNYCFEHYSSAERCMSAFKGPLDPSIVLGGYSGND